VSSAVLLLFACGDGTEPGGPSNVDRIIVAPEPFTESGLVVNETRQLKVFLLDTANAVLPDAPTTWHSSDPAKASVSSAGLVTAKADGHVTIMATAAGVSGDYELDVLPLATSLELIPRSPLGLVPGDTTKLIVIFRDALGNQLLPDGRSISWTNQTPELATVDGDINANLVALLPGTAQFAASGSGAETSLQVDIKYVTFTSLATGLRNSCGISTIGETWCWGTNVLHQLATPIADYSVPPFRIEGLPAATAITAGEVQVCVLAGAGDAWCWGGNGSGETGKPAGLSTDEPVLVTGGHQFAAIQGGEGFTCGLTAAGQAWCWGYGGLGALGRGDTASSVTPVAVAGGHVFASISIDAQGQFACGLTADAHAYCWGLNDRGQLGDGTRTSRLSPTQVAGDPAFSGLAVGADYACGLVGSQALCWGDNSYGQLGQAGAPLTPAPVDGGLTFSSLATSATYACGVATGGQAYCWGLNDEGQLGTGTTDPATAPTAVTGGLSFASLTASDRHTCGLTTTQVAYCWGGGDGTGSDTIPSYVPARVIGQP
jgi:alpha-tubulin suppressor-like RCC1 family protein